MSYKIKYIFLAIAIVSGLLAAYLIKGVYSKYGKINKTKIVSGKDSLLINSINFNMEVKGAGHGHKDFKTGIETFTLIPNKILFISTQIQKVNTDTFLCHTPSLEKISMELMQVLCGLRVMASHLKIK